MRFLEIIMAVCAGVLLCLMWWPATAYRLRSRPWREIAIGSLAIIPLLHILIEGYRWQMVPLYLWVILTIVAISIWAPKKQTKRTWWQWLVLLLGSFAFLITWLPPIAFPIPDLPAPTGPHAVGTTSMHLVDSNRAEIYGENSGQPREFMVQLWYPAEIDPNAIRSPFLPNAVESSRIIATRLDLPPFTLDHVSLINGIGQLDVAISPAETSYPLLVFSHGYESLRGQSTTLMEDLASHGYIVASMEHTYGAAATIFPDGRIEFLDPITLSGEGAVYDANARRLGEQWQKDIEYLLVELEHINQTPSEGHLLAGAIDLDRLGMFGHSTGGGVVVRTCQVVNCVVTVGLDAWFGPVQLEVIEAGSDVPTFFFMSEYWPKEKNIAWIDQFISHSKESQWFTIAQTGHYDFSDIPFLSPLTSALGLSGEIDSTRGQEIVRAYTRAYFDTYLKEVETDLFDGPSHDFPEVTERLPE